MVVPRFLAALLWAPTSTGFTPSLGNCGAWPAIIRPSSDGHHVMASTSALAMEAPSTASSVASSLALSYAVRVHPPTSIEGRGDEMKWELHPLSRWEEPGIGEGTLALRALSDCARLDYGGDAASCTIRCQWRRSDALPDAGAWCINVSTSEEAEDTVPRELLCILSRIMVQSAASEMATKNAEKGALLRATLPLLEGEGCQKLLLSDLFSDHADGSGVRHLFAPLNPEYATKELVDMVDSQGRVLGSLPRPYIHSFNILHRGVGLIVSKDEDILDGIKAGNAPDVYVHQRTPTKRIFPSLYDMFVGGVSTSGEDPRSTAAREVAEELGLTRALDGLQREEENETNPLSEKLFQCTVCTSYNRCVVSMFTYTCDTARESISWQEEEVSWGAFVRYPIVELAGQLSIDRLVESGVWPGRECSNEDNAGIARSDDLQLAIEELKQRKYDSEQPWETWDFVPDGLLVWKAWNEFVKPWRSK